MGSGDGGHRAGTWSIKIQWYKAATRDDAGVWCVERAEMGHTESLSPQTVWLNGDQSPRDVVKTFGRECKHLVQWRAGSLLRLAGLITRSIRSNSEVDAEKSGQDLACRLLGGGADTSIAREGEEITPRPSKPSRPFEIGRFFLTALSKVRATKRSKSLFQPQISDYR
jgi:hypothetical protein